MTDQTQNIAIGHQALSGSNSGESYNIAIGHNAMKTLDGSGHDRNIAIGAGAMDNPGTTGGADNIFMGYDAGGGTWTSAASNENVGIGNYVMDAAMNGALYNTALQTVDLITDDDKKLDVDK